MRFKTVGNKADSVAVVIRNADTVVLPPGVPVCLNMNGTNDGLDVVLPNTGGATKAHAFAYGVVLSPTSTGIAVNAVGESQIFGLNNSIVLLRGTRAASTDSWTSTASIASYVLLTIDTVNNAFQSSGGTQAATAYLPFAVLAQSVASVVASASATSDTRTAITSSVKAFLRMI